MRKGAQRTPIHTFSNETKIIMHFPRKKSVLPNPRLLLSMAGLLFTGFRRCKSIEDRNPSNKFYGRSWSVLLSKDCDVFDGLNY